MGQQVWVDNRPGASGIVGTDLGAKARRTATPWTMAVSSGFGINPSLYPRSCRTMHQGFRPDHQHRPHAADAGIESGFAAKSVRLIRALVARPNRTDHFASLGAGLDQSPHHGMFRSAAGLPVEPTSRTRAAPPRTRSSSRGRFRSCSTRSGGRTHVKSGRLRGLGIGSAKRSPFLPDVPTIAESGFPGFEAVGWIGIAAPARTPPAILDKLHAEIVRIINTPEMKERLATLAFTPVGDTREAFARFIRAEIAKWGQAVKESGAKAE